MHRAQGIPAAALLDRSSFLFPVCRKRRSCRRNPGKKYRMQREAFSSPSVRCAACVEGGGWGGGRGREGRAVGVEAKMEEGPHAGPRTTCWRRMCHELRSQPRGGASSHAMPSPSSPHPQCIDISCPRSRWASNGHQRSGRRLPRPCDCGTLSDEQNSGEGLGNGWRFWAPPHGRWWWLKQWMLGSGGQCRGNMVGELHVLWDAARRAVPSLLCRACHAHLSGPRMKITCLAGISRRKASVGRVGC